MKKLRDLRLLSGALLLAGCAISKPIHYPGLVADWNKQHTPLTIEAPRIAVVLHVRRTLYDDRPSPSWLLTWQSKRGIHKAFQKVRREFPFLGKAELGGADALYQFVIEATHARRSDETRAWLTALSLGMIPHSQELSLELEARLYRGMTLIKTYQATGSHQLRINFLSILLLRQRINVPKHTMEDTFRDLFLQIQQDAPEVFKSTEPGNT